MKHLRGIAALSLLAATGATAPAGNASAAEQFVIGVSNTHIGNSWREEFVCSIKAEALASGLVSKVILANREAGPSEQIADLRTMISAGVNVSSVACVAISYEISGSVVGHGPPVHRLDSAPRPNGPGRGVRGTSRQQRRTRRRTPGLVLISATLRL